MNWAILSDVHGNLEAFKAVIADLRAEGAEGIFFLGDGVGYGANPDECLLLIRELTDRVVAGNHDYGTVGLTDISFFNPAAQSALLWTRENLSAEGQTFLRGLPLRRRMAGVTFVHASPHEPEAWNYIFTYPQAEEGFRFMDDEVAFIGHSHQPLILAKEGSGEITVRQQAGLILSKGVRYIINVGSVGQPRDGNPHAAYGLFNETSRKYLLRRVPYDIGTAQRKIIQAGLPPYLALRLSRGV